MLIRTQGLFWAFEATAPSSNPARTIMRSKHLEIALGIRGNARAIRAVAVNDGTKIFKEFRMAVWQNRTLLS
ncbi:MAG: hypothetical protein DMG93_13300 [Acidobacteria bacterium]|nr:MAG: hypothetical protein DMG93_13300 [Acidobacteriota bacterium]